MSTPPIRKRLVIGRPLTAEEHDANLDAVVNRGNHTGTQLANTISNLRATVLAYDFIQTLIADVDSLETAVEDLENEIASNPTLSSLVSQVNSLASQLLIQEDEIEGINTALTTLNASLATKVDRGLPNQTITARLAFAPPNTGVSVTPFTVSSNANAVVSNLNADLIDGLSSADIVQVAGSTMTGPLVLQEPTADGHAANKGYVDSRDNDIINSVTIPIRYSLLGGPSRVVINSGTVLAVNGTSLVNLAGRSVNIPTSQTVYVCLTASGNLFTSLTYQPNVITLMQVVGPADTAQPPALLIDFLRVRSFLPAPASMRMFGGAAVNDLIYTTNQTITTPEVFCRNLTINAGVTVTVSQATKFYCSGNVTINGTLIATPSVPPSWIAGDTSSNLGGRLGTYSYIASPVGSSGANGLIFGTQSLLGTANGFATFLDFHPNVNLGSAGAGGSSLSFEVAGTFTLGSAGLISCKGGNATAGAITSQGVPDNLSAVSGNGGGSGGSVVISTFGGYILQGTVDVSGGVGSNSVYALGNDVQSRPGGGGGGGWLVLSSSSVIVSSSTVGATLNVSGGASGNVSSGPAEAPVISGGNGGSFAGVGALGFVPPQAFGGNGRLIIQNVDPR